MASSSLSEDGQRLSVFWLLTHCHCRSFASGQERRVRSRLIAKSSSNDGLIPLPWSKETVVVELCSPVSSQRLFTSVIITLFKRQTEPGSN